MSAPPRPRARDWLTPAGLLALVILPPLLASAPGRVVADTDPGLTLDPDGLLGRLLSSWDPGTALGTVPDQRLGLLWPAGPFFWVFEQLGFPDWVAQRLWLGGLLVAAGAGVLFLGRSWRWRPMAAGAAAFVYALSPAVLAFAAPRSVQLLPFAGLPWLLGLTVRALHTRGWRHPVFFGLTLATVGAANPASVPLVGLVPLAWIVYVVIAARTVSRARAVNTALKLAIITVSVNLWWAVGLSVAATDGIGGVAFSVTPDVVAEASIAGEVLRGLGNWRFYDLGPVDADTVVGVDYTERLGLLTATFALPVLGLLGLGIVRWRHRAFVVVLTLVGLVVTVGAHPWGDPAPLGALIKLGVDTELGVPLRSLHRAVPLLVLAVALGVGSLIGALAEQSRRRGIGAALATGVVAVAALPPLWTGGLTPDALQRPEDVPEVWTDTARHLSAQSGTERVLELPGSATLRHTWGATAGPVLGELTDRPHVLRRLAPEGSPASADVLRAFDVALQEQRLDPDVLAPLARLLGIGDVVVRGDDLDDDAIEVHPHEVWDVVRRAPGLVAGPSLGATGPAEVDEALLTRASDVAVPAVATLAVPDPRSDVRTASTEAVVLVAGDGAGLIDAFAAGLLRGTELIRYSASLTGEGRDDFVVDELVDQRALIVTDTNRRRAQRWDRLAFSDGYTELADGGLLRDDPRDRRLDVLPEVPGGQTVVEHGTLRVRATDYGGETTFEPSHRPAAATDGDLDTAWRVAAGRPLDDRIELTFAEPVTTDHLVLVQAPAVPGEPERWITDISVRFDGGEPMAVRLAGASRLEIGQRVEFNERRFQRVTIDLRADTAEARERRDMPGVGFAEIDIAGVRTDEVVRMPDDLLEAGGYRTLRYPLALVATRLRAAPSDVGRADEERRIVRAVAMPAARTFSLQGTARLASDAPTAVLDAILGRDGDGISVTASSLLPGGLAHLPSNVADDRTATRWTSAFDVEAPSVTLRGQRPLGLGEVTLLVADDDRHRDVTRLQVVADGTVVADEAVTPAAAGAGLARVEVSVAPTTAEVVELVLVGDDAAAADGRLLPIAVAEVRLDAVDEAEPRVSSLPLGIDTGCREDLVAVDGIAIPVRVTGSTHDARAGHELALRGCTGVELAAGDRRFTGADGAATGIDVDQLVWRSAAGGDGNPLGGPLLAVAPPAPDAVVTERDDTTLVVDVTDARPGTPFWLVLGQSHNPAWSLEVPDAEVAGPLLVDGHANGWLVTPTTDSFQARMRWVPQNRVEIGLLLSLLGVAAAIGLLNVPSREVRPLPIPLVEPLRRLRALTYEGALPTVRDAWWLGVAAGAVALVLAGPAVGVGVGILTGFTARREQWRPLLTLLPAGCLALIAGSVITLQYREGLAPGPTWPAEVAPLHPIGMAAVLLLVADVAIDRLWVSRSDYR